MTMKITPIPAFTDNYIWCLENTTSGKAAIVDPGQAAPVEKYLSGRGLELDCILLTHHHPDHAGGVDRLRQGRPVPVYGPVDSPCGKVTEPLREGDSLDWEGLHFQIYEVPGHTLDHIAFFIPDPVEGAPALFCGDTLFICGCGRLFEGEPAQMRRSLAKLRALPDETRVYCAHEYTLANLRFSRSLLPDDEELARFEAQCQEKRNRDQPTVPGTLAQERRLNPFLRWDDPQLLAALEARGQGSDNPDRIFASVRQLKDRF